MTTHTEPTDPGTDPCPIHTLDDAVTWLAARDGSVEFYLNSIGVWLSIDGSYVEHEIGTGGFDARGTLMMACRELWRKVQP